jgi:hypothetical protein
MDPANGAHYYAPGAHRYFDIGPLKYSGWDEYASGVRNLLAGCKYLMDRDLRKAGWEMADRA